MLFQAIAGFFLSLYAFGSFGLMVNDIDAGSKQSSTPYRAAQGRLKEAITNPEYMLNHWIELPIAPNGQHKKMLKLTLHEAILLALRYNPNIQNAELDRIIQRYQLRLAHNAFELQYALAGSAAIERSHYDGVGTAVNKSFLGTPELN